VKNEIPPEMLDKILDAFAVKSDVAHVAITTGFEEEVVRDALASPETALLAMRRKAAQKSVWLYGSVFDILDDMVRNGDTKEQIQGIKLYREFLKDIPPPAATLPEPEGPKLLPPVDSTAEEVIDVEPIDDVVVNLEDLVLG
jgi:hypothetical protein